MKNRFKLSIYFYHLNFKVNINKIEGHFSVLFYFNIVYGSGQGFLMHLVWKIRLDNLSMPKLWLTPWEAVLKCILYTERILKDFGVFQYHKAFPLVLSSLVDSVSFVSNWGKTLYLWRTEKNLYYLKSYKEYF